MPVATEAQADAAFDNVVNTAAPTWNYARLHDLVVNKATQLGIDPALALALTHQESKFDPTATSGTGVQGLLQVTNDTGASYGQTPATRLNPEVSADAGLRYFKDLLVEAKGNIAQALRRYNTTDPDYVHNVMQWYPAHAAALGKPVGKAPQWLSTTGTWPTPPAAAPAEQPRMATEAEADAAFNAVIGGAPAAQTAPALPTATSAPVQDVSAQPANQGQVAAQAPPTADEPQMYMDPTTGRPVLKMTITKAAGTDGPPAQAAASPQAQTLSMLPGFEWMGALSPAQQEAVAQQTPGVAKQLAAGAISTAGAAGGAALGTMVQPGLGTAVGEMGGSAAARWLNVKLGLEEPGTLGNVLSVAVPGVARMLPGMVRQLPGASAVGHELAQGELTGLAQRLTPAMPSDALFAQAAQQSPPIAVPTLWQAAGDIAAHELGLQASSGLHNVPLLRTAQGMLRLGRQYGQQIPMSVLNDNRERLGLMIGQAAEENWPQLAGLRQMYGGLMTDLENAASQQIPGAQTLTQAIRTARHEFATEDLADLWAPGRGIQATAGDQVQVNGQRILNQFDNMMATDARFAGSFSPAEAGEIRRTLQTVANLTAKQPSNIGAIGKALTWGGRIMGYGLAAHENPLIGAAVDIGMESAPDIIAAALRTPIGRAALRSAFADSGGVLTQAGLATIHQAVAAGAGEGVSAAAEGLRRARTASPAQQGQ